MLALPEQLAVSVPLDTVFVSPVIASTYVPFGIPENVEFPEIVTSAKLSVFESVYLLLNDILPLHPSVEYCPFLRAGIA